MKTFRYLLTELEIQRLAEYSKENPGNNIWVKITPNGIGNVVQLAVQNFAKDDNFDYLEKDITDGDSW